jgi:hypothetical protein
MGFVEREAVIGSSSKSRRRSASAIWPSMLIENYEASNPCRNPLEVLSTSSKATPLDQTTTE